MASKLARSGIFMADMKKPLRPEGGSGFQRNRV